jgi:hypothetical protein
MWLVWAVVAPVAAYVAFCVVGFGALGVRELFRLSDADKKKSGD